MTESELLTELNRLVLQHASPEDVRTSEEWADALELGHAAMLRRLKAAKKAGQLEVVMVPRERLDGIMQTVRAYRLLVG